MRLSEDTADDLLMSVAIAALYYDQGEAGLVPDYSIGMDVDAAMEAVALVDMPAPDRERLRELCAGAISAPTTGRRPLLEFVLAAIPTADPVP